MANSTSAGGAYLPAHSYTRTGATDTGGTYKTATLTSPTLTSPTISGTTAIGAGATVTTPQMTLQVQSVTAAGTSQGTAAAIAANYPGIVVVTAANTTKGVVLPASVAGALFCVQNSVTNQNLLVYPASGEIINALSSNTAYTLAGAKTSLFACQVAGTWFTLLTA